MIDANPEYVTLYFIDRVAIANRGHEIVKHLLQNDFELTEVNSYLIAIQNGDVQMLDILHDYNQLSYWRRVEQIEEILKNVKIPNKEEILAWCTKKWKLQ